MKKILTEIYNLMESKDFEYVAKEIVRHYGLPTKVKFTMGKDTTNKDKGDYKFKEDTIYIRPKGYKTNRDFIETLLHEIHHAVRVHRYGLKKFLKKYAQADNVAMSIGGERYRDNKWEKKAEGWAQHEYKRYFKDKFFDE
jgi:hypothetical protein|tara:strand:- start:63 stop:482 length:420 start_codon:yes stop_codon:yes gene_type:complete